MNEKGKVHKQQIKLTRKLASGTLLISGAMGARTLGQGLVFLLVARELGVNGYGAYSAVLALAMAFGIFSGMGSSIRMLRDVARDPSIFADAWGKTLAALAVTYPLFIAIYGTIAWIVLPAEIPRLAVVLIGISEIVCMPFTQACVNAYQAHERITRAAKLLLLPIFPRMVAAGSLLLLIRWVSQSDRLDLWGGLYLISSLISSIYMGYMVIRDLDEPKWPVFRELIPYIRQCIVYAIGGSALKFYADLDKIIMARLSDLTSTGAYSVGYRIIDFALIPLHSFLIAVFPQFFKADVIKNSSTLKYGLKLLPLPMLYAVVSGLIMFGASHWLPLFFGNQYYLAINTLKWLCWLPMVSLPRMLIQNLLIGRDCEKEVISVLVIGVLINAIMNYKLIPIFDWRGAVLATYFSEVLMLGLFLMIEVVIVTKKRKLI